MSEHLRASPIVRALVVAGLFLGITAAMKLGTPEYISAGLVRRLVGIMMGCIVMLYSNTIPKQLTPLVELRCDPAAEQSIRRFSGFSLVFGGAGYALAWMIAPIDAANLLAACALGLSLLAVAIRYGALFAGRAKD